MVGGVIVAEFDGGKVAAFRNDFDNAALLEQMLTA